MRFLILLAGFIMAFHAATKAENNPYHVDYENAALKEKSAVAECFSYTTLIVERFGIQKRLVHFLEAVCESKIRLYKDALLPHLPENVKKFKNITESLLTTPVAAMERAALDVLKTRKKEPCSGNSCALIDYRVCLLRQLPDGLDRRLLPSDFETVARQKCIENEANAEIELTLGFSSLQLRQSILTLSDMTRSVIKQSIEDVRREIVVMYGENLNSVLSGRHSCTEDDGIDLSGRTPYDCTIGQ